LLLGGWYLWWLGDVSGLAVSTGKGFMQFTAVQCEGWSCQKCVADQQAVFSLVCKMHPRLLLSAAAAAATACSLAGSWAYLGVELSCMVRSGIWRYVNHVMHAAQGAGHLARYGVVRWSMTHARSCVLYIIATHHTAGSRLLAWLGSSWSSCRDGFAAGLQGTMTSLWLLSCASAVVCTPRGCAATAQVPQVLPAAQCACSAPRAVRCTDHKHAACMSWLAGRIVLVAQRHGFGGTSSWFCWFTCLPQGWDTSQAPTSGCVHISVRCLCIRGCGPFKMLLLQGSAAFAGGDSTKASCPNLMLLDVCSTRCVVQA
jgi:hypothetical protein